MDQAIRTLLDAEARAQAILEETEEVGLELRRLSESQAREMVDALRAEARDETSRLLGEARKRVDQEARALEAEGRAEFVRLEKEASIHREAAIEWVVTTILGIE